MLLAKFTITMTDRIQSCSIKPQLLPDYWKKPQGVQQLSASNPNKDSTTQQIQEHHPIYAFYIVKDVDIMVLNMVQKP